MPLFRQLELDLAARRASLFGPTRTVVPDDTRAVAGRALRLPHYGPASGALALQLQSNRDHALESLADSLLRSNGAASIASQIRVEWRPRLKTCAGRADYKAKMVSLNPLLREHGADEIRRTLLHELAHLLAQFRAGRRRIPAHGDAWRRACRDLGIGDERRCHNLPFPISKRAHRYLYRCPKCRRDFGRVRRIRRAVACLACCRAHTRGKFDKRFRLKLVNCNGAL